MGDEYVKELGWENVQIRNVENKSFSEVAVS